MIRIGITWSFSKLSAQIPIKKPNNENVTHVKIKKNIIIKGCSICRSTNNPAVKIITVPIIRDLVAAAPTNPKIISDVERGAANYSHSVLVNFVKKIPKEALDIDWVSTVSIIMPRTINDP